MSNYIFAPSPCFGISEHPFVTYRDAFSSDEITKLIKQLDALERRQASIGEGGNIVEESIRSSTVAWLSLNDESQWIYDRMAYVARVLNGQFYKFDLYGFNEDMQYTVYEGESAGHYDWHVDAGAQPSFQSPRKFSMVLQLSDSLEYVGGDLEIFTPSKPSAVDKQKGLIAAFPSYTLHRVTPVLQGVRKTLVVWVCGPSFR